MAIGQDSGELIQVKVRLYAMLRRYLPELPLGQPAAVELPVEATLGDLLDRLGIPRSETKTCFVNGLQRNPDYHLEPGDDVGLFPPIAGGSARP